MMLIIWIVGFVYWLMMFSDENWKRLLKGERRIPKWECVLRSAGWPLFVLIKVAFWIFGRFL